MYTCICISSYQKAISMDPQEPLFYLNYTIALIKHGRMEIAVNVYKKFQELWSRIERNSSNLSRNNVNSPVPSPDSGEGGEGSENSNGNVPATNNNNEGSEDNDMGLGDISDYDSEMIVCLSLSFSFSPLS